MFTNSHFICPRGETHQASSLPRGWAEDGPWRPHKIKRLQKSLLVAILGGFEFAAQNLIKHDHFLPSFLDPFTKYKVWVKAFTWKNEGQPSEPFEILTDVDGPSAPVITNLVSCNQALMSGEETPSRLQCKETDFCLCWQCHPCLGLHHALHPRMHQAPTRTWAELDIRKVLPQVDVLRTFNLSYLYCDSGNWTVLHT